MSELPFETRSSKPEIVVEECGQVSVDRYAASTYAEATWTQGLADWIGSHTRAFAFIGAVPAMVVSDNLKSGVAKACFYEPAVNRTYAEMAAHYDTAIVPARPYKPRDKTIASYCTLLGRRGGDGKDFRCVSAWSSASFTDCLPGWERPEATVQ